MAPFIDCWNGQQGKTDTITNKQNLSLLENSTHSFSNTVYIGVTPSVLIAVTWSANRIAAPNLSTASWFPKSTKANLSR